MIMTIMIFVWHFIAKLTSEGLQMISKHTSMVEDGNNMSFTFFFLKNLLMATKLRVTFSCKGQVFCFTSRRVGLTRFFGTNLRNVDRQYENSGCFCIKKRIFLQQRIVECTSQLVDHSQQKQSLLALCGILAWSNRTPRQYWAILFH